jgi:hypothetical protein
MMAMQKKLWSINGLANELGMDRRTMAKRLAGLPPATEKKVGNRTEKRWYLADVLAHLKNPRRELPDDGLDDFKHMIGKILFPAIIDSKTFGAVIVNGCMDELGIDKAQGLRIYSLVVVALTSALSEIHEDDTMAFAIPDHMMELSKLGPEAYLEKYQTSY